VRSEHGQATIDWTATVLVVALALGALLAVGPRVDGRSFGAFLAHEIACAIRGGCDDGDSALARAYGERDAALVRAHAPGIVYEPGTFTLPIDWRSCRSHRCSDAPDDRDLDAHYATRSGLQATAFTRVVRRGGETFIQYWLYYPDSTTTAGNAAGAWNTTKKVSPVDVPDYPGAHKDDWESFQVRIDSAGRARVRASSHHWYQGCKQRRCRNTWTPATGWTRVSRGSHAGHIPLRSQITDIRLALSRKPIQADRRYETQYPGLDIRERTSSAAGLRLVPLETIDRSRYRPLDDGIKPPWEKEVYREPESDGT